MRDCGQAAAAANCSENAWPPDYRAYERRNPPMLNEATHSDRPAVLVVDDSPEMRRYLQVLLEMDSYFVETACNGLEALERLDQGPMPSVVLLDLEMPGLNGLDTLAQIRRLFPRQKVIICSGWDALEARQQASALGAEAFLAKPVKQLYLSAAIERCLDLADGIGNLLVLPERAAGTTA